MVESRIAPASQAQPAASDDEKAAATAAAAAEVEAHPNRGQFVLYLGPRNAAAASEELKERTPRLGEGTFAEITAAQWSEVGLAASRGHKWSLANNWMIPATQFSRDQIDYLLTNSKRFELVDVRGQEVTPAS